MVKLQDVAKDTVDIEGIGFYTLGPIRKTLSEENKERYATSTIYDYRFGALCSCHLCDPCGD